MKSEIDKSEMLKAFPYMHKNNPVSEIKNNNNVIMVFTKDDSELWWNYALINNVISNDELDYIENFFKKRDRLPSIYFSEGKKSKLIINFLKKKGYELTAQDSWLFWNKKSPIIDSKEITKIETDIEFEEWIRTYIKSYPKEDPKNPYGDQTEFAEALKKSWYGRKKSYDTHYLSFKNNKPVATAILTNYKKIGYLTSIGSIPSVRGEGYGKKISLYCVQNSIGLGNKHHFLVTEKGDYPYEFYKRIGFEPEFVAYLYTKK